FSYSLFRERDLDFFHSRRSGQLSMKSERNKPINKSVPRIAHRRSSQTVQFASLLTITFLIISFTAMAHQKKSSFADLTKLFAEWRAFQQPKLIDGVPDYSTAAMSAQHRELTALQRRLADIDTSGWTIPQQVDWHIVRAEMN